MHAHTLGFLTGGSSADDDTLRVVIILAPTTDATVDTDYDVGVSVVVDGTDVWSNDATITAKAASPATMVGIV